MVPYELVALLPVLALWPVRLTASATVTMQKAWGSVSPNP